MAYLLDLFRHLDQQYDKAIRNKYERLKKQVGIARILAIRIRRLLLDNQTYALGVVGSGESGSFKNLTFNIVEAKVEAIIDHNFSRECSYKEVRRLAKIGGDEE
jgi:phosphoserine aminotransferase